MRFSDEEVRRYARQMVLPEVGGLGQARLRAARASAGDEVEALYLAAAGVGTLDVPSEAIADLERSYPGIKERICDEKGAVRRFVNIFVKDEDIRFLQNLDTPVKDSDEISIVPAIAGGR